MSIFNLLNPGPTSPPPYQQPNAGNPAPNPAVANYATGADVLKNLQPIPEPDPGPPHDETGIPYEFFQPSVKPCMPS
jgi:hypothetical protein